MGRENTIQRGYKVLIEYICISLCDSDSEVFKFIKGYLKGADEGGRCLSSILMGKSSPLLTLSL